MGAVNTDLITGLDELSGAAGADHAGNTKLAGDHGGVGQGTAGIGDQSGDLGEGDDPGGVGHLADQDLAVLDGIQLGGIIHQMGNAFLNTGTAGDALQDGLADLGLLAGKKATCNPCVESYLDEHGAKLTYSRVTVDDNLITSQGMGTAIAFGLAIFEYLKDHAAAKELASKILYRP